MITHGRETYQPTSIMRWELAEDLKTLLLRGRNIQQNELQRSLAQPVENGEPANVNVRDQAFDLERSPKDLPRDQLQA
jgi:hypothetical protein